MLLKVIFVFVMYPYEKLAATYGADPNAFERLCRQARARTSFPGGGERVEQMLKGDLSALWFFDSLLREKQLRRRPGGGPDVKLVYNAVVAELHPLLNKMVPPGGELLSFIDYTASRVLQQRALIQAVPADHAPSTLIFTLADDNVGVLPQLAYQAIREALEAYAGVAKDHGDLGGIALMNEYCYRPIRDKRNELK